MVRLLICLLISMPLFACVPFVQPTKSVDCTSRSSQQQMLTGHWLQQPAVWRLQQSALLELGPKKIPMQGFLQLDTAQREARLLAMNEMGLVLFDLQLDEQNHRLNRAIPQLQKQPGFAIGVAGSLRRIFLRPAPLASDQLQLRQTTQRLWRLLPGGSLGFVFSCEGELQETQQVADFGNWRVRYLDYQTFADQSIPQQIVFDDYQHGVKLTLWLQEAKRENE